MTTVETDRDLLTRYANVADGWLGLRTAGVEVAPDGTLQLRRIPDAGTAAGPEVTPGAGPAPAGCTLDSGGTGWVAVPDEGRVLRVDRCAPVDPELARPGDTALLPGLFTTPRGLLLGPRGRLYVADAGADAVVVIEPDTGATTARWTDTVQPWCLSQHGEQVYVLDRGGADGRGRVRRFDADGVPDAAFGAAVAGAVTDAVRMTVAGDRLLVLDRGPERDAVVPIVLGGDGGDGTVDTASAGAWAQPARTDRDPVTGVIGQRPVSRIGGLAGDAERVYVIDAGAHDLLTYTRDGEYVGASRPLRPVADVWRAGPVLWTSPVTAGPMLRHAVDGARLRVGAFVCGPVPTGTSLGVRELRVDVERGPGGHLQLWTAVTRDDVPPSAQSVLALGPDTVPGPGAPPWAELPADVDVALIAGPPGPQLFVGGQLGGDGSATPVVHQLGVGGAHGWIELLPAVYRKDVERSVFLDRYLRLIQSVQAETAQRTAGLVRSFDPWTADDPTGPHRSDGRLDALAEWVDVELDERWDEQQRRRVVADAVPAQALRGTPLGLTAAISARFGDAATVITQPGQRASIWSLGGGAGAGCGCHGGPAGLGFDTMLVAGPADGAVLGASAVVGQSSLTAGRDVGAPLFADLAHRFHVSVRAPGLEQAGGETALRAVVDAESPAHTAWTLCVIGPHARVGVQARVGVDTIVAGPPPPIALDETHLQQATLAAAAAPVAGRFRLGTQRLS